MGATPALGGYAATGGSTQGSAVEAGVHAQRESWRASRRAPFVFAQGRALHGGEVNQEAETEVFARELAARWRKAWRADRSWSPWWADRRGTREARRLTSRAGRVTAAITLQCFCRLRAAQREVAQRRLAVGRRQMRRLVVTESFSSDSEEGDSVYDRAWAATMLQCAFRRKVAMGERRRLLAVMCRCLAVMAVMIQCAARRSAARREAVRRRLRRGAVRCELEHRVADWAAVTIQCGWRRRLALRRLLQQRTVVEARRGLSGGGGGQRALDAFLALPDGTVASRANQAHLDMARARRCEQDDRMRARVRGWLRNQELAARVQVAEWQANEARLASEEADGEWRQIAATRLQAGCRRWLAQRVRWNRMFEEAQLALAAVVPRQSRPADGLDWGLVFRAQSEMAQRFGPQFLEVAEANLSLSRMRAAAARGLSEASGGQRATPTTPVHGDGGPYRIL